MLQNDNNITSNTFILQRCSRSGIGFWPSTKQNLELSGLSDQYSALAVQTEAVAGGRHLVPSDRVAVEFPGPLCL